MLYCDKCKVHVRGGQKYCPLCQGRLTGEAEEPVYPVILSVFSRYRQFFQILLFISFTVGIVSVMVNLFFYRGIWWSFFVVAALVCVWITLLLAIRKRYEIAKNIIWEALVISLLCVAWDHFTGWRGWSVNYVVPIACMAALASLAILGRVLHLPPEDKLFWMVAAGLFGIIPFVLYQLGAVTAAIPSLLCATLSLVSLAGLFIFQGRRTYEELKKKMHI